MNIRLGLVSGYSLLYGVHSPAKLLGRAASLGIKTVSICDINNVYGVHSFIEAAKERNIQPIIGAALTNNKYQITNIKGRYVIYCFVENKAGFARLCELLTLRNKDKENFNYLPHLRENSAGLVLASSDESALEYLNGRVKYLYAAITPADIRAAGLCRKLNIHLTYIDNSVFLEPEDFAIHRVLRAIELLKTVGNLGPEDTAGKESVLRSSKEIHRRLASWPEAVRGTEEIAALCTYNDLFGGWIFPGYVTEGLSAGEELRRRVYQGNAARYGELGDSEVNRIEYELGIIEEKGFSSYFLTIDDIVKIAELSYGKQRTCGRGSGAASIVSYGLGITNVDPLRHNLYFERFLNPARHDPPDLDIDFAWDERDELIKAVIEKFGSDHCARVANHNMFRYRSALRETAKAFGFGDAEITQTERKLQITNNKLEITEDPQWKEIFYIATKIEGLPRGLGMHCGGIVITPDSIWRHAPIEKSAEGFPLLAWEKDGTEAAGFVKIDLLGNRSLAVIRDTIANIKYQISNEELDERLSRAVDNKETIDALARGDSMGVFYIESPAMRQLQKKTNRGDFEHIVIHSSIIRPAANKFISEYVRRLKGGKWEPLHPRLEKILDETYGILCYQEDVSKAAVALAGFDEADADKLRKVIAKKMGGTKLSVYQNQFYEGCRKNNVSEETTKKIWEMMLSFDGYSFCKPHSASYAMVSFQSAYLRVHHPAEFMAAVLSNQGGYYRPHAYIAEIRRMRLITKGPDVNISQWKYYGITDNKYQISNSKEKMTYGGEVIIGLMAIKGLSVSGAEAILEERDRGGYFTSLDDFSRRVKLGRDDITALCPAGVFDSIAESLSRPFQARFLLGANSGNEKRKVKKEKSNGELFETKTMSAYGGKSLSVITPQELKIKITDSDLWEEYKTLGFLRNVHPLALWKNEITALKHRVKALDLDKYIDRNIKLVGWPVTQKDVWTKDGLTMSFLSLEDETALYETVIFPQVYERYNKLLFDQRPLLVHGRVTNDNGAMSVEVSRIEVLGKQSAGETFALRYVPLTVS
ncbi:MAG: DNA polymerase III subunit alpha [Treponema sp.]|jgi:DNA polymerase-3 subunit alpha/error-prone DNA polymerase|nr:DNA polymerase III subunit alpha [Treponema sp.]